MLLLPFRSRPLTGLIMPAALALWRPAARTSNPRRIALLGTVFGFTASEARFAHALLDGSSIAEAAQTLGLTLQTARQYSKQLYSKAGVRGHADLVGRMMTSVVSLL